MEATECSDIYGKIGSQKDPESVPGPGKLRVCFQCKPGTQQRVKTRSVIIEVCGQKRDFFFPAQNCGKLTPFFPCFVSVTVSVDWVIPMHVGVGSSVLILRIRRLLSSENTDTPRKNALHVSGYL